MVFLADNQWENRHAFEKKPNKFFPIDVVYGDVHQDDSAPAPTVESRLDRRVQALMSLIFDKNMMEQSLLEMEIDLQKMPLGKLSKRHIQTGYEVLKKVECVLQVCWCFVARVHLAWS